MIMFLIIYFFVWIWIYWRIFSHVISYQIIDSWDCCLFLYVLLLLFLSCKLREGGVGAGCKGRRTFSLCYCFVVIFNGDDLMSLILVMFDGDIYYDGSKLILV